MDNTNDILNDKWVNLNDVAEYLSVSTDTIRNWIKAEKIPYYRLGKQYKFKISEIDQWVRDRKFKKDGD